MTSRLGIRSAAAPLRARCWFLLALMGLVLSNRAAAQTAAASMALPLSCAEGATSPDTARLMLTMLTRPGDSVHAIIADLQAQAVADNFRPPAKMTFLRWPFAWDPRDVDARRSSGTSMPGFEGELALIVDHSGRLREAAMTEPLDVPELNRSLVEAAWRTDSAAGYERFELADSTLEVRIRIAASSRPTPRERPLVRLAVPFLRITTHVGVERAARPRFPDGAREEGFATFSYVVAENGRADSTSLRLIGAQNGVFIPPAREAILRSTYTPAKSGACRVPEWVQQRVAFRFRRPPGVRPVFSDTAGPPLWPQMPPRPQP